MYNKFIKFTLLVGILMSTLTLNSQVVKVSDMSTIKPGTKINCIVDFAQCSIMGMSEADFSIYEKDWETDKPSIIGKIVKGANSQLDGILKLGYYKESPYILKITVITITDRGNIICDASIIDNNKKELFQAKNINGGKEPPFLPGTKLAKIKGWANLVGRNLGSIIKTEYLEQ